MLGEPTPYGVLPLKSACKRCFLRWSRCRVIFGLRERPHISICGKSHTLVPGLSSMMSVGIVRQNRNLHIDLAILPVLCILAFCNRAAESVCPHKICPSEPVLDPGHLYCSVAVLPRYVNGNYHSTTLPMKSSVTSKPQVVNEMNRYSYCSEIFFHGRSSAFIILSADAPRMTLRARLRICSSTRTFLGKPDCW